MKIMLVDDHPVVRQGLRQMLTEQGAHDVVAEAASASDALLYLQSQENDVDLLILDLNLPDQSGFSVLDAAHRIRPELPVLILSIQPAEHVAVRALRAGASGYLNKEAAPEELARAVKTVSQGRKYIDHSLAEWLALDASGQRENLPHERLSDREYQVLCLLAGGKSVSEIAELLSRSPNTISTYRSRILQKLGITTNAGLTQYAIRHQIIR